MADRFKFYSEVLHTLAGGRSVLDLKSLHITSLSAAESFINSYGFNLKDDTSLNKLWYYHRRAIVLITEKLGFDVAEIPEILRDRKKLEDIRKLLVYASSHSAQDRYLQRWSCAILRCMHVYVHAEHDMFSFFSEEIQKQILTPLQNHIVNDGTDHKTYLSGQKLKNPERIELISFQHKPFKTSASSVIKLLAKPDAFAMRIFDKLGVRFVTKNIFDSFRLMRFLVDEDLISYPHIMPDQSSNNVYPVDTFLKVMNKIAHSKHQHNYAEIENLLNEELLKQEQDAIFIRKENEFSGAEYKFIKFISRKLITIKPDPEKEAFSFFYPFEVQIMDENSYKQILSGPSEHVAYKERQILAARKRVLPNYEE